MITLQFVAAKDFGSRVIQIYERGWPSHVDAVAPDGSLYGARNDKLMGAPAGVQMRPSGYYPFYRLERYYLPADAETTAKFWEFLRLQEGKPYDQTAILAFAFQRDWREPDSWFCSELIAAGLLSCGWFWHNLSNVVSTITPRDLLLLVSPWSHKEANT